MFHMTKPEGYVAYTIVILGNLCTIKLTLRVCIDILINTITLVPA